MKPPSCGFPAVSGSRALLRIHYLVDVVVEAALGIAVLAVGLWLAATNGFDLEMPVVDWIRSPSPCSRRFSEPPRWSSRPARVTAFAVEPSIPTTVVLMALTVAAVIATPRPVDPVERLWG